MCDIVLMKLIPMVTEYVLKYASKEAADEAGEDDQSDEEMSSAGSYRSDGEEEQPAGEMEEL
jgi:ubiquitin-conjugating enzyme E2 H